MVTTPAWFCPQADLRQLEIQRIGRRAQIDARLFATADSARRKMERLVVAARVVLGYQL